MINKEYTFNNSHLSIFSFFNSVFRICNSESTVEFEES